MANNTFAFEPSGNVPRLVQVEQTINSSLNTQTGYFPTNLTIKNPASYFCTDLATKSTIYSDYGNQARDLGLKFEIDHELGHSLLIYKQAGILYLALVAKTGKILNSIQLDEVLPDHEGLVDKYLIIDNNGNLGWKSDTHTELLFHTTEYWDSHPGIKTDAGTIYVYTNKFSYKNLEGETIFVPGLKIGDGNAYLIDKPFITDAVMYSLTQHLNDTLVHVSNTDRARWDNKLNVIDPASSDLLEFTRD